MRYQTFCHKIAQNCKIFSYAILSHNGEAQRTIYSFEFDNKLLLRDSSSVLSDSSSRSFKVFNSTLSLLIGSTSHSCSLHFDRFLVTAMKEIWVTIKKNRKQLLMYKK